MNTGYLDELLGTPTNSGTLFDNWQTAFIWLVIAIIGFALISLFFGFRRVSKGENVNKGMLPYVKWPLLFASAGFNVFFTYYVFLPAGHTVAIFSAIVMGGVNLAEAYLVRLIIATWRHDMKLVFKLALLFTVPVFVYSLMAAGSSFTTMMMKNKDSLAASQLELQAAQDTIGAANSAIREAEIGEKKGDVLNALYQTEVRNSRGTRVSFGEIKNSCKSGGWYAHNYPEICSQYQDVREGVHTASSVAAANTEALSVAATKKLEMAQIIKDRPPAITPTLLGFSLGLGAVGFIVSLALESAIIGVGFFEELFIKPTPLPGIVSFVNKALDWDADSITQRGLQVDISPSPGTVNFSPLQGSMTSPFSSVGWSPKNPRQLAVSNGIVESTKPVPDRTGTVRNATVTSDNVSVPSNTTVTKQESRGGELEVKSIRDRLIQANKALIGDMIECVICGTMTKKRIETKKFCSPKCRIEFHKFTRNNDSHKI